MYTMCHSKPLLSSGVERGACIIYTVDEFLKLYFLCSWNKKGSINLEREKNNKGGPPWKLLLDTIF